MTALVAKIEKNLTDHTEFLNYKEEMDKWLAIANDTLEECAGIGNEAETRQKLAAVTVSTDYRNRNAANKFQLVFSSIQNLSSRLPEGQHLLGLVQDAFTKATNLTPEDKQDALRANMNDLRTGWDNFTTNIQNTQDLLKSALSRWEEHAEQKNRFDKWLNETEAILAVVPDTRGELSEMKTSLERFKHLNGEISSKGKELDHLVDENRQLSAWTSAPTESENIQKLQQRWEKVKSDCDERVKSLDVEVADYNAYSQKLQEAEKWLLQVSFQLMAHNSLYITNREQTQDQINQHENLLNEIQKYQLNLDDLKAKGQCQIERYEPTSPAIRGTIETQLRNIQDSYDSLLNTSVQIRNRLQDSLAKFEEYENTLDSIGNNLNEYEPIISTDLEQPATTLEMAQDQLKLAQSLHNKLQAEKSRLALAVQACEAATASISRPSSPLEATIQQIPEKELMVRAKLEDLIDQVNFREEKNINST